MGILVTRTSAAAPPAGGDRLVGDEYWASDLSDGPLYGANSRTWNGASPEGDLTTTLVATGGPNNRPYVALELDVAAYEEYGTNWSTTPYTTSQVSWGDTVYARWSIRQPNPNYVTQKFLIHAPGGLSEPARVVLTMEDWGPGFRFRLQKDGGDDLIQYPSSGDDDLTSTGWFDYQMRITFSSALGVADGSYAMWVNNDTATPTAEVTGITVPTSQTSTPDIWDWSGYIQRLQTAPGPMLREWHWADIRVGPTFDDNWHGSGAGA